VLGQVKINKNLTKKMANNNKMLENINSKLENLSSTVQNHMSFNRTLEKQIAQLAAAVPISDLGETSGKPEVPLEFVNMVSTNFSKRKCQRRQGYFVDPPIVTKMGDPGCPTITCAIGPHVFTNAFCDLGASINVMSKVIYDKTLGGPLSLSNFRLQMADQSSRRPVGIAKDILVRIQDQYIPTDFTILDMGQSEEVPLLLGRPFLNTTNVELHVGIGYARFHIQGKTLSCPFNGLNIYKSEQPKKQRNKNFR